MKSIIWLTNMAMAAAMIPSTNLSAWSGLRGAQIQTTIVLEGGTLSNGTWKDSAGKWDDFTTVDNTYGYYYHIDLKRSFNAANDSIDSFMFVPEKGERSDPNAPNYQGGALFSNGYEFYTFGGQADKKLTSSVSTVTLGKVNNSSPSNTRWGPGLSALQFSDIGGSVNQSNYIMDGAYTSMPDQEAGYLFSGTIGYDGGYLSTRTNVNKTGYPTATNTTFIKVNMTVPDKVSFDYLRWPSSLSPRAQGGLVWLPYGSEGVLVAIGGNELPGDNYLLSTPPRTVNGDKLMTQLAIYDIANDTWYEQPTTGSDEQPRQTAKFCTATVATEDGNSHEIFVYGGYGGTKDDRQVRDDVWVLSIPAFHWTRLTSPAQTSPHGRYGSVCFAPNPSTLIIVGGSDYGGSPLNSRLIVDVLDLNSGLWTSKYNSSSDAPFKASADMQKQLQWPSASGPGDKYKAIDFLNGTALNSLFQTRYTGKITKYWPYPDNSVEKKNKGNSHKTIIIATTCTIIPIALIALTLFFCIRRRRNTRSFATTQQSRRSVFSWLSKDGLDPEPEKSDFSGDTAVESNTRYKIPAKTTQNEIYEAPNNGNTRGWHYHSGPTQERYEIMDNPGDKAAASRGILSTPGSVSAAHSSSIRSGDISSPAEMMSETDTTLRTSPSEFPPDSSTTSQPPNDLKLDQSSVVSTTQPGTPKGSTIPRKPVGIPKASPLDSPETLRPNHRRNVSSLSDIPTLPSPEPQEAKRQSRQIEALPDIPTLSARQVSRQGSSGRISVYKENFDEEMERKQ